MEQQGVRTKCSWESLQVMLKVVVAADVFMGHVSL
jgi:hypothetical protein